MIAPPSLAGTRGAMVARIRLLPKEHPVLRVGDRSVTQVVPVSLATQAAIVRMERPRFAPGKSAAPVPMIPSVRQKMEPSRIATRTEVALRRRRTEAPAPVTLSVLPLYVTWASALPPVQTVAPVLPTRRVPRAIAIPRAVRASPPAPRPMEAPVPAMGNATRLRVPVRPAYVRIAAQA